MAHLGAVSNARASEARSRDLPYRPDDSRLLLESLA